MSPGERRHETCRHGSLTPAWTVSMSGRETPTLLPLCGWANEQPDAPPAMRRAWGGLVEFDRDCAVCQSHEPVLARDYARKEG